MDKVCGTCLYYGRVIGNPAESRYAFDHCSLTGKLVCSLTAGCSLYLDDEDLVSRQQVKDENWRPGASVPLAVSEQG